MIVEKALKKSCCRGCRKDILKDDYRVSETEDYKQYSSIIFYHLSCWIKLQETRIKELDFEITEFKNKYKKELKQEQKDMFVNAI